MVSVDPVSCLIIQFLKLVILNFLFSCNQTVLLDLVLLNTMLLLST
jgi:hypothetical protein